MGVASGVWSKKRALGFPNVLHSKRHSGSATDPLVSVAQVEGLPPPSCASAMEGGGEDEGYWETAYDESGNAYYYHTITGETTWVNPYEPRTLLEDGAQGVCFVTMSCRVPPVCACVCVCVACV